MHYIPLGGGAQPGYADAPLAKLAKDAEISLWSRLDLGGRQARWPPPCSQRLLSLVWPTVRRDDSPAGLEVIKGSVRNHPRGFDASVRQLEADCLDATSNA